MITMMIAITTAHTTRTPRTLQMTAAAMIPPLDPLPLEPPPLEPPPSLPFPVGGKGSLLGGGVMAGGVEAEGEATGGVARVGCTDTVPSGVTGRYGQRYT